ncbi:MAG: DUF5106 domain-containing protein [Bacteroidia bacterium]|nr:DUF5106 domain-containing protein [Bacteroidia bacterium]
MNNKFLLKTAFLTFVGMSVVLSGYGQKTTAKAAAKPNTAANSAKSESVNVGSSKFDVKNIGRDPGTYAIKVKIKGLNNIDIYLADNFADKQYFRDTCHLDANGVGTFTGNPKLQRGMYMIVFPQMDWWFELPITDDQVFYFEADTSKDETKIKVEGSAENIAFAAYQKQRAINGRRSYDLEQQIKQANASGNTELKKALTAERDSLEKVFFNFREKYMTDNSNHLLTKIFKAFTTVKIPANPDPKDSMYDYRFYKNHFWDNIDFNESGLIRAPQGLLTKKIDDYIDKLVFQDYDSLTRAVDYLIGLTVPNTEIQKYFVQYLTQKFQDRKVMCMDNITIHMINRYYCTGRAWWYDDTAGKKKMCDEARRATPTMCGKTAPDLNLADTAGKFHRLYENMGIFTIVFFYDPTCGHCKQAIPIVNAVYQKYKAQGIKVYAVSTEGKYTEWRKLVRENKDVQDWLNVCKTNEYGEWPLYRYYYNIQSNPTIFILDSDAKILGKKIDEHQLEFFLGSLLFEKGLLKERPQPPKDKPEDESHSNNKDAKTEEN